MKTHKDRPFIVFQKLALICIIHLLIHIWLEYGGEWAAKINHWICDNSLPKKNWWMLELGLPSVLMGILMIRKTRAICCPLPQSWSFILYPVFVVMLDIVHLLFDHRGLIFWCPNNLKGWLSYIFMNIVYCLLFSGFTAMMRVFFLDPEAFNKTINVETKQSECSVDGSNKYYYTAMTAERDKCEGVIFANNLDLAIMSLKNKGLFITSIGDNDSSLAQENDSQLLISRGNLKAQNEHTCETDS